MQTAPAYDDVVAEVRAFLVERASCAGLDEVWIDPGIGFGKTLGHNLALLAHLGELVATGYPVLVGTSRKAFLGRLTATSEGVPAEAHDRVEASVATATWALAQGAAMVRVHDVAPTVAAARLLGGAR